MATLSCGKLDINPKKLGKFAETKAHLTANNQRTKSPVALAHLIIKLLIIKPLIFMQIFS
jgi:hypothetical protein